MKYIIYGALLVLVLLIGLEYTGGASKATNNYHKVMRGIK